MVPVPALAPQAWPGCRAQGGTPLPPSPAGLALQEELHVEQETPHLCRVNSGP